MNLTIDKLTKSYDDKIVLDNISIDLKDVQVLTLIGASGSGKSTLLRLIAGLEEFDLGEIIINDHHLIAGTHQRDADMINKYRKKVGFVFQDHNLFSHLSILENICLVLEKVHRQKRVEFMDRISRLLKVFDLSEHQHKLPHQISGGQSQRASIARALAIEPEMILLDEPTSSLDPILTYEVLTAIEKLVDEEKRVILVTHEIGFAKQIADYIVFMDEGKIIEHGGPEIFQKPQTEQLKRFLEKVLSFNG